MGIPQRLRAKWAEAAQAGTRDRLVLGGLILLALSLRLACLTFQPLWWDEGWSLYFAQSDIHTLLELTAVDIHPPLYYLLLHLWTTILGSGVLSVRLFSVLIGTATVPLLYAAGRRLLGRGGGLLAAALLALSPFHIYYSQEVRMYGLVTLLGLAALTLVPAREPATWGCGSRRLGAYVLAATAALYTQYYAAFLLLALNVGVAIRWLRPRRPIRTMIPWLGAQVAVVILYLPWLWYAGEKLLTYIRFKVGVEQDPSLGFFTYVGRHLAAFTWGHAEGPLASTWWVGLLPLVFLLLAGTLLLIERPRPREKGESPALIRHGIPGLTIIALVLACGFGVNLVFPFNPPRSERLLLLALPAYLLLIAATLLALWRRRRRLAAVAAVAFLAVVVLSLAFFYSVPRYPDDDYRPVARQIGALSLPGDAILCIHPWQVGYFQAYLAAADLRPSLVLTPRQVIPYERQLWADDPARLAAELKALLARHGRLWLPAHQTMGRMLESQIEVYLAGHAYPTLHEWYGSNTLLSFFVAGEPVAGPVTAHFGEWLALERAGLSPGPLEAGWGVVTVELAWELAAQPGEDYTLGLRLVGPTGHVWAQGDSLPVGGLESFAEWPAGETHFDRHGLLVPAGTPPGDYRLTLRVYRSRDVAVLPVTFEGGSGGEVTLGTVRIVRPQIPPPLEALEFTWARQAQFGAKLQLLGYSLGSHGAFRPGEAVEVDFFWQALAAPGEDFLPRLQLVGFDGEILAEWTEKPVAGTYPTAWWQAGELVHDRHALPLPATVPPGYYHLVLSLVRAADGQPAKSERGQTAMTLIDVQVVGREHRYQPTLPKHPQVAQFGSSVELVGYDLGETSPAAGAPLEIALHWHARETLDRNYRTFVHLLDAGDVIVTQHDGTPGEGQLPTLGWLPGEYLVDSHRLYIPVGLPAGDYRLAVGFYDPVTSQRLGDRLLLDTPVTVGQP